MSSNYMTLVNFFQFIGFAAAAFYGAMAIWAILIGASRVIGVVAFGASAGLLAIAGVGLLTALLLGLGITFVVVCVVRILAPHLYY